MAENSAATCSVTLEGEWRVDNASDLLELLAGRLARLLEAHPRPDRAELDMSRIAYLDACGCQLLAVFLENLRRRGIAPVPCNIPRQVIETIDLLGFAEAFAAPEHRDEDFA